MFKSDDVQKISVSEAAFPLGRAYKDTACILSKSGSNSRLANSSNA